jgi:hypothetical protein
MKWKIEPNDGTYLVVIDDDKTPKTVIETFPDESKAKAKLESLQRADQSDRKLFRYIRIAPESVSDDGTFQVAISSEYPAEQLADDNDAALGVAKTGERYLEVLSHAEPDVNIERLNNRAAFLDEHRPNRHLGNVVAARLSPDKIVRGVIKFDGASKLSKTRQKQIRSSRPNISLGYSHTRYIGPTVLDDGRLAHRFAWSGIEVSSVANPADPTVGFARSMQDDKFHCIRCGGQFERTALDDQFMCSDCADAEDPDDATENAELEKAKAAKIEKERAEAEALKTRSVDFLKSTDANGIFEILTPEQKTQLQRKFMPELVIDEKVRTEIETKARNEARTAAITELEAKSGLITTRNNEIRALEGEFLKDKYNWVTGKRGEKVFIADKIRTVTNDFCAKDGTMPAAEVRGDYKAKIREILDSAEEPANQEIPADLLSEVGSRCRLMAGIRSAIEDNKGAQSTAIMPKSGAEKEYHDEICRRLPDHPGGTKILEQGGFFLPNSTQPLGSESRSGMATALSRMSRSQIRRLLSRDALAGDFTTAGAFIQPQFILPIIELLRNRVVCDSLGATFMGGLMGDVILPRQEAATTAQSLPEGAVLNPFDQVIGQLRMTPKRVGSTQNYSRLALLQTTPDFEAFVRDDHFKVIAIYMDEMALNGSGQGDQPLGILNQIGISSVLFNGTPTYAGIVSMRTKIRQFNVPGPLGFTTTSVGQGRLSVLPETLVGSTVVSGSTAAIWKGDELDGTILGARAIASQQVPGDLLVAGVWSNLIIGQWGGINVVVDNYTRAGRDEIVLTLNTYMDTQVRHAQAFCRSADSVNQ